MKISLIAIAAVAATSAFAQSTVTLYGRADANFGSVRSCGATSCLSQTRIDSGGQSGSRWGMNVSEDLGGGLKANVSLESGFNIDTGSSAQGGRLFGRQAWVGMSGGFGSFKLGRTPTPLDDINPVMADNVALDLLSLVSDHRDLNGVSDYDSRQENMFAYYTPKLGGFSAAFQYALGENKTATKAAGKTIGLNVKYANGPLAVALGYQNQDPKTVATTIAKKYISFNGAYNFGAFEASAGINTDSQGTRKDRDFNLGATIPFGAFKFGVGLISGSGKTGSLKTSKSSGYGLTGTYELSKRTNFYGGLVEAKEKTNSGVRTESKRTFAIGIRHRF